MNTSYEKAVFCRNIAEVERVPANTDRIYYGHETCERLLPSTAELDSVLERTNKSGRALTLVTPFLTDVGLDMAESLFARLPSQTEVVCNDWGVVSALREFDLAPALGRLLIRAYKGHEFDLGSSEPSTVLESTSLHQGLTQSLLQRLGVKRVELDNTPQGWTMALPASIACSMYTPFVYAAAGRKCLRMMQQTETSQIRGDSPCGYRCKRGAIRGRMTTGSELLVISGNAQYLPERPNHREWRCKPNRMVDVSALALPWA